MACVHGVVAMHGWLVCCVGGMSVCVCGLVELMV